MIQPPLTAINPNQERAGDAEALLMSAQKNIAASQADVPRSRLVADTNFKTVAPQHQEAGVVCGFGAMALEVSEMSDEGIARYDDAMAAHRLSCSKHSGGAVECILAGGPIKFNGRCAKHNSFDCAPIIPNRGHEAHL